MDQYFNMIKNYCLKYQNSMTVKYIFLLIKEIRITQMFSIDDDKDIWKEQNENNQRQIITKENLRDHYSGQ